MGSFKTRPLAPTIGGASRYELRFLLSVVHERSVLRRARGFLDSSITVISRVICSTQLRRLVVRAHSSTLAVRARSSTSE